MVTEDAFHGNLGILIDISPKMHGYVPNYKCKDFVHITPLPMSYNRSKLLEEEPPSDLKGKIEKILKGSLDSIPSPSPSVCLRCKGKMLLLVVNKL